MVDIIDEINRTAWQEKNELRGMMPSGDVYTIDTGANITVHKPPAKKTGKQRCFTLADGTHGVKPEVVKNGIAGIEGPKNLIGTRDLPVLLGLGQLADEQDKSIQITG